MVCSKLREFYKEVMKDSYFFDPYFGCDIYPTCERCSGEGKHWTLPEDFDNEKHPDVYPTKILCKVCEGKGFIKPSSSVNLILDLSLD